LGKTYIILTWIGTVFLAPLIGLGGDFIFGNTKYIELDLVFLPLMAVFGFVLSLPALIVYLIGFSIIRHKMSDSIALRLLFLLFSLILIAISFWILGGYWAPSYATIYAISNIATTLLVWLRRPILRWK
jgi:hypothetical protein